MCDFDGYSSTAIGHNFIKLVNPNQRINVLIHVGKEHGIVQGVSENMVQQVIDSGATLLICPDAASNDAKQCHELHEHGIDVLILDHHEITTPPDEEDAILINHHLDPEHLNIHLSGAGVTFKAVQACAEQWGIDIGDLFYDLVASSLATDSCSMLAPENYAITKYGFAHLTNPMLIAMCEKFNTRGYTPEGVSWGLGPKVNAVIRGGSMEDKRKLFMAFVGEGSIDEAIEIAKEHHKEQGNITKKVAKIIDEDMDYSHKVLVGFSDSEYKNYSGLVANQFCGKYAKPTLILRFIGNNMYGGSLRSPVDIADKINDTGLAHCQGHLAASGIFIRKENLYKLVKWFDSTNLDMEPCQNVVAIIKPEDISLSICKACENNKLIWAKDIEKPQFYISLETKPTDIFICGKRGMTVKINNHSKASIIKMTSRAEEREMLTTHNCKVELIVSLSPNEYNGVVSPQAKIESWEITPIENKQVEEDWRDLF